MVPALGGHPCCRVRQLPPMPRRRGRFCQSSSGCARTSANFRRRRDVDPWILGPPSPLRRNAPLRRPKNISPRGPKIFPSRQKKYIPPPEKNISFGAEKYFPRGRKIFPAARSRRRGLRFNCVPSGLRLSCKRQKIRENISTTGAPASAEKHAKSNVIFPRRPK